MEAKLCFIGHGLMENRSGLIVDARLTRVSGHAERLAALEMIAPRGDRSRALTLGADRGYDAQDLVMELRELNVRPLSPRTPVAGARRSIGAPRGTVAMRRASGYASGSRRRSAGSRRWPA
jgi:hypothetical protein